MISSYKITGRGPPVRTIRACVPENTEVKNMKDDGKKQVNK